MSTVKNQTLSLYLGLRRVKPHVFCLLAIDNILVCRKSLTNKRVKRQECCGSHFVGRCLFMFVSMREMQEVSKSSILQPREVSHSSLEPRTKLPIVMWKYVLPEDQFEMRVNGCVTRMSYKTNKSVMHLHFLKCGCFGNLEVYASSFSLNTGGVSVFGQVFVRQESDQKAYPCPPDQRVDS